MSPRRHGATAPFRLQARVGCLLFGSILRLFGRSRRIAVGDIFEQAGRRLELRQLCSVVSACYDSNPPPRSLRLSRLRLATVTTAPVWFLSQLRARDTFRYLTDLVIAGSVVDIQTVIPESQEGDTSPFT